DNPVLLTHASGHAIIANKKAMELAGITNETVTPPGGEIVKDENGNPTGVFKEDASSLIYYAYNKYLDKRSPEEIKQTDVQILKFADEECLTSGITSVTDASSSFDIIDLYKELYDKNKLNVRMSVMIYESNENLNKKIADYKIIGYANNHLTVRAIKQFIDGALGSRSAWFFEPYNDKPTDKGINVTSLEYLEETANIAIDNDFQLCTHAIGDRGNKEMLDIYEKVMKQHPDKKDLRWRIEHAQHLAKDEINRFYQFGVIASMQGCHATSDGPYIVKRLGEKRGKAESYIWRDLLDAGTLICNGTDAPVELVSPILCFYSSVTRKMSDGIEFTPEQKMTRMEALESYTINSAYASFEENIKGSLEIGKLADIVVLSNDLLNCSDEDILKTEVLYTIIGGKILYQKK
ncbi:MAG: amidohydrolase, partial [Ignavibacteriales bacterium]|nr:amidohydrolase [Ignavibacteriales bacterium]